MWSFILRSPTSSFVLFSWYLSWLYCFRLFDIMLARVFWNPPPPILSTVWWLFWLLSYFALYGFTIIFPSSRTGDSERYLLMTCVGGSLIPLLSQCFSSLAFVIALGEWLSACFRFDCRWLQLLSYPKKDYLWWTGRL